MLTKPVLSVIMVRLCHTHTVVYAPEDDKILPLTHSGLTRSLLLYLGCKRMSRAGVTEQLYLVIQQYNTRLHFLTYLPLLPGICEMVEERQFSTSR